MAKTPARHVSKPTPHQSVIHRGNAEQPSACNCPDIHNRRRTRPCQNRAYQKIHDRLHLLALRNRSLHSATSSGLEVKRARHLDIVELARRSGLPASTLRFYEQKGLIASTGRRGLRRVFAAGVIDRLALIALGSAAGFSLDEIARLFAPDGRPRIERKMLAAKAAELDKTIRRLSAMREGLRHAAVCPAPSHMECPTFRRLLDAAASGTIGLRRKKTPPSKPRRKPNAVRTRAKPGRAD